jgi:hypothetical protein
MATEPDVDRDPDRRRDRGATGPAGTLEEELRALRQEVTFLREHRLVILYQSVPRILLFRFASGMAVGLGTVIGATVLLSAIIWALSQIEFVPIIGEWAVQIVDEIEASVDGDD